MGRRYDTIDTLRGAAVASMLLYHFCWDLRYIARLPMYWYGSYPAYLWQQSICWSFILISGYCAATSRHLIRNGIRVSACGALVTLVTCLLLPEDRVVFGVLTLLGACMLIVGAAGAVHSPGRNIPTAIVLAACALIFITTKHLAAGYLGIFSRPLMYLPRALYRGLFMTFIGFTDPAFYSTDYFPLLPWFALFLCGYFLRGLAEQLFPKKETASHGLRLPLITFMGRHSLLIYMLHQPILYAITLIILQLSS